MEEFRYDFKNNVKKENVKSGFLGKLFDSGLGKIGLIIFTILLLLNFYRSLKQTIDRYNLVRQAENEVQMLRLENLKLSLRIVDASSQKYLEKEARNKLNYGRENEVVFVIPDDLIEEGKTNVKEILEEEKVVLSQEEVLLQWVELVVNGY